MPFPLLDHATDLLTDDILPLLHVKDVLALAATCRALHQLICSSEREAEMVWKRRIQQDLRFPVESTARQQGWLELYKRLRSPNLYLWGEAKNARLGLARTDPRVQLLTPSGSIPVPARLHLPTSIVDIVAGGWSFHALTVEGQVYHWGQLDGNTFAPFRLASSSVPRLAHPGAVVITPKLLEARIPPIERLVAGRRHVLALDDKRRLWTWANWAEAGLVSTPWSSSRDRRIVDFAAGWQFSAALVESEKRSGPQDIYVWWQNFLAPSAQDRPASNAPQAIPDRAGCYIFKPRAVRLPDLPQDAESQKAVSARWQEEKEDRITKMAAGDNFLVVLTASGKVYRMDLFVPRPAQPWEEEIDNEDGNLTPRQFEDLEHSFVSWNRRWEYLPKFSESRWWKTQDAGQDEQERDPGPADLGPDPQEIPDTDDQAGRKINFISASFQNFFAIGDGVVLRGGHTGDQPVIQPELQNRDIIRVECGDYHFGALSSSGRLYTFGEYSNGALGHGRDNIRLPEDLRSPRRSLAQPYKVEFFDPLRSRAATSEEYCFNVAMAGWASSALTVDLTEGDHLEKERVGNENSGPAASASTSGPQPASSSGPSAGISTNLPFDHNERVLDDPSLADRGVFNPATPFRIGFPGRGAFRGGGNVGRGGFGRGESL